jgi:hypothetical protein
MTRVPDAVRQVVRQRAERRCEYCHMPEDVSAYAHHVEHIISLKHGGSSGPDNLAWACFQCNVAKGSDVAACDEETGELTPLYDPRTQVWGDHFEMDGACLVGKTPAGRVTVRLLQINHPERIEARHRLMKAGLW